MPQIDFDIPIAAGLIADPNAISIDRATELIFNALKWPLLGGPSGKGWSFFSTAQRCARLFQATYDHAGPTDEAIRQVTLDGTVPAPLQIGALYHTLEALYYGAAMSGEQGAVVAPDRGGLCASASGGKGRRKYWKMPGDAVEQFLAALKAMANIDESSLERQLKASLAGAEPEDKPTPSSAVILEAERLFDAHAHHWTGEDVEPLAIEWFARHPLLGYTCRYDMIGRVGPDDPFIPEGNYIFERKTTKWIDEAGLEGWSMDGEILGQLLLWKPSGCEDRFGKLDGLVMDIVSKAKVPECKRLVLPADLPPVGAHARWVEYNKAQIAMWRATKTYPQSFANCWTRYGRCANWNTCALGVEHEEIVR